MLTSDFPDARANNAAVIAFDAVNAVVLSHTMVRTRSGIGISGLCCIETTQKLIARLGHTHASLDKDHQDRNLR